MKKYPAFIIDRSRRSEASRFSDDFIVCTDKEVGFIARAYKVPKSRRVELLKSLSESGKRYVTSIIGNGDALVVIEIEQMLHEPVAHISRIDPLLKKAMKAYLYGEVSEVRRNSMTYDDQIAALDDVIRLSISQRSRMIDMNGKIATDKFINSLRAAKESIFLLQKIIKHE